MGEGAQPKRAEEIWTHLMCKKRLLKSLVELGSYLFRSFIFQSFCFEFQRVCLFTSFPKFQVSFPAMKFRFMLQSHRQRLSPRIPAPMSDFDDDDDYGGPDYGDEDDDDMI